MTPRSARVLREYALACREKQHEAKRNRQEDLRLVYSMLRLHANKVSWFMQPGNVACVLNGLPYYKVVPPYQQIDGVYLPRILSRMPKAEPRQLELFELAVGA